MRDATIGLDGMVPSTTLEANKRLLFLPLIGHSAPERDVVFEPTPMPIVRAMLELAMVGPPDVVYDLGSGDGRIPMTAAKEYGAVGRLVASVLFGLAEIEQEYRRERQAAGIVVAKRKGRYRGRVKGTTKAQPTRVRILSERGFTVAEIVHALQISPRTVYRYLATGEKA